MGIGRLRATAVALALLASGCGEPPPREATPASAANYLNRTSLEWHDAVLRGTAGEGDAEMDRMAAGGAAAVPVFLDIVERESDATGAGIATESTRLGESAIPAFRAEIASGATLRRRAAASLCLARFGDGALDAAPAIAVVAIEAENADDRSAYGMAVGALRMLGPGCQDTVADLARREDMRTEALAIAETWSWLALPLLGDLARDGDEDVAKAAVASMATIRSARFGTKEMSSRAKAAADREALPPDARFVDVAQMQNDDRAEFDLDRLTVAQARELLLRAAENPAHGRQRRRAILLLAQFGAEAAPAIPFATLLLASPDVMSRQAAAGFAAAIGPEARDMVPALVAMADENFLETRLAAVWALGQIGPAAMPARDRIEALWRDQRRPLGAQEAADHRCFVAGIALANIDPAGSAALLAEGLDDPRWPRRQAAINAVAVAGGPAVGPTAEMLASGSTRTRQAAALALHMGGEENVAAWFALARATDDADAAVRLLAEEARMRTAGLESAF